MLILMILRISPDIKKLDIFANGPELAQMMGKDKKDGKRVASYPSTEKMLVHTFENPVLITDNYRTSLLQPTIRDTIFSLYASRPRIVEYDGVSTFWDSSHTDVWCPSIDTILYVKALRKILNKDYNFKNAIEIGCGSGFISKYLLDKSETLESVLINDLNPFAIKCAKDNINDKRANFLLGNGLDHIKNKKFDLILCNPPYIPRPKSIDDNPYEGIFLLHHLLQHGREYLNKDGVIVLNCSNLSWELLSQEPIPEIRIIDKMTVPLKVNNVLNNKEWVEYLKGCGLKKEYKDGYDYWQELTVFTLNN